MRVSDARLKEIANRNLGVMRGYAVDIGLSELAEIARELQSWRDSGALEALKKSRRSHHYCEDGWYSCPKSDDGCANQHEGTECNCGADEVNAVIDAAIAKLEAIK